MTAKRLRVTLLILMLVILSAIIGGFVYAERNLRGYAESISKLNADAKSGDQNIATLRQLETTLAQKQLALDNAHMLVADSATYSDTAIADISRIAAQSGVAISSYDFVDSAGTTAAAGTTPTTGATPKSLGAPAAGVTKKTISVIVASPLKYANLMNFIQGIETNKLKMQIATVAMTKDEADSVGTQTFSIGVYVR